MLRRAVALLATVVVFAAAKAQSQSPTQAIAVGWSPAAGLIGAECVKKSFSFAPRLGGALGVGLGGFGARLNLSLRRPTGRRAVPYLGVGYAYTPWFPVLAGISSVETLEGGVQFWPARGRHFYADVGAGYARVNSGRDEPGVVIRALLGRAF